MKPINKSQINERSYSNSDIPLVSYNKKLLMCILKVENIRSKQTKNTIVFEVLNSLSSCLFIR